MKQSPENWRELGYGQPPAQGSPVHNWWDDWYTRILQSQTTTNAMPGVFNPLRGAGVGSGEDSPATKRFGVFDDPAFIRGLVMGTPPQSASGLSQQLLTLLNQIPAEQQGQVLLLLQNFIAGQGTDRGGSPTG